jgi:hypothetical protein
MGNSIVGPFIKSYGGIQQRVFDMLNEVVIGRLEDKKNGAPEPVSISDRL